MSNKIKPQPTRAFYEAVLAAKTDEERDAVLAEYNTKYFTINKKRILIGLGAISAAIVAVVTLKAKDVEIPVVDEVVETIAG